jgi:hypothetical protein
MRALSMLVLATGAANAAPTKPAITDTRCATPPTTSAVGFRHKRSKALSKLGSPSHRGVDLIASEDDTIQHVEGKLAYGKLDKDIDDEDVEVFACVDSSWKSLGVARTDDDGRFEMILGDQRLPVGMRDLYAAALGDGTGAYFVGYVAPRATSIVVTDVDGTISWSENSIIKTVIKRTKDIGHRPSAPGALQQLPYPIVYVTARGDAFIDVTRQWLERHGFPRGLLRLSRGAFAKPGSSAVAYKKQVLRGLTVPIAAGIGNRRSDITAYSSIGLAGNQIFIHLPEYAKEVKADLDAGNATGFADYATLPKLIP